MKKLVVDYLWIILIIFALIVILNADERMGMGKIVVAACYLLIVFIGTLVFKNKYWAIVVAGFLTLIYIFLLYQYVQRGTAGRLKSPQKYQQELSTGTGLPPLRER